MHSTNDDALDAVVAGLLAERYAPSPWWTPQSAPRPVDDKWDDSELTTARRRRQLLTAARPTSRDERLANVDERR